MKNITIIGAGFSGMLLSINLLKQASAEVSITMIDRNPESDMGPAYSGDDECLLLNVPAGRMGAFSSDPAHFLKWALNRNIHAGEWDFLPRKFYREYIKELFQTALNETKNVRCNRIEGEATDITLYDGKAIVILNENEIIADKVVLAFGNFLPSNLPVKNSSFYKSNRYIQNPWSEEIFSAIRSTDGVFLIGTGQTTIDIILRLHARKHKGKIIALSRRGLLPLTHTTFELYPSFYDEVIHLNSITGVLRVIRKHFVLAEQNGMNITSVIDSIRPYTQELWMKLPLTERSRFLRHLFRYFEIIRSRIPSESMEIINQFLSSGQLMILKGRIHDIIANEKECIIQYLPYGELKEKFVNASIVINTIGPELNYTKVEDTLIKNLLAKGLIQPHDSLLGIKTQTNGAIINAEGETSKILYTLGSTMRGVLWEVIAAPEIRLQAEQLAHLLIN